jgi:hypothetical protein
MIRSFRDDNYLVIVIKDVSARVKIQSVLDTSDVYQLINAFMSRVDDDTVIKLISSLKADRDLIAYGISLSGATESDKITEIDGIIRQLSARFIK